MGSERKSSFISDEVKKMTAYHEVGFSLIYDSHSRILMTHLGWACTSSSLYRRRYAVA